MRGGACASPSAHLNPSPPFLKGLRVCGKRDLLGEVLGARRSVLASVNHYDELGARRDSPRGHSPAPPPTHITCLLARVSRPLSPLPSFNICSSSLQAEVLRVDLVDMRRRAATELVGRAAAPLASIDVRGQGGLYLGGVRE